MSRRINFFITGVILIILGVITLHHPLEAIMSAGFFIGLGLIASGINYFTGFKFLKLKRFLVWGLLDLVAGVIMLLQPGISAFIMPFVIAFWLFTAGVARTCTAFWLGGASIPGWKFILINGLLLIACAVLMCISPLNSALSVMAVLSGILIVSGVFVIFEGFITL
ncbi:MAG: DUF308 domain-containing protein [Synergistaceae bacterium]|nr:DUF308 domain-containing protein [Synergistaceae bacterium]